MNARQVARAVLLAGAAALTIVAASSARAQVPAYEVRSGDTLFGVARKAMYDGVTRNQMILAIYRANQNAFAGGNINRLEVGAVLSIPVRDEVARIAPAEADRQVRVLLAAGSAAASPPLAALKPEPAEKLPAPSAGVPLGAKAAEKRYLDGLASEQRGDDLGAFAAFLEAGEAGHGLAQRKLGQIYDKGNAAVPRDYQTALKWYEKARAQGVEIDKPLPRTMPR